MYVRRLTIENIRGFGGRGRGVDLDFVRGDGSLAGWTVIAGRNGAGKTTLLQALAAVIAGPRTAAVLQESWANWIHSDASHGIVEAQIFPSARTDQFADAAGDVRVPFPARLRWTAHASGPEPALSAEKPRRGSLRPAQDGPWGDNPSGWLVAGYGPFRRIARAGGDALRLMIGPGHVGRLASLFREDASLAESVRWLEELYLRSLEEQARGTPENHRWTTLLSNVLALLDDGLLPPGMRVKEVTSDGLWVDHGGIALPLTAMSDGHRVVAALVLDIARCMHDVHGQLTVERGAGRVEIQEPAVVLIDEIDAHLHVTWQQRIGFWLKAHFPYVQFLVSTHSPFICQAADDRGLIRLPGPSEARSAEHVSHDLFRQVVNGGSDEATLSELFGLEHSHSDGSEKMRERVAELEARLIRGNLDEEARRELERLRLELPPSGLTTVDKAARVMLQQIAQFGGPSQA